MAHEARSSDSRLSAAERPVHAPATVDTRSLAAAWLAVPPLALLGVGLLLAFRGGGSVAEDWTPVAVGAAVAVAALAAVGSLPSVPRHAWPAIGALVAFLAWSALSLSWSVFPEATVETVARLALLLVAAAVGAAYAARRGAATVLAAGLVAFGATLAIAVEVKILAGSTAAFSGTRLAWPIDYANGNAALLWLALPALIAAAAADRIRPLGRALAGGLAALALAEGLMTLSRGAVIALVAALAACVVLAGERSRLGITIAALALPVAAFAPRLTAGTPGEVASDATSRGTAAAWSAAAAALLVLAVAAFERLRPSAFARGKTAAAVTIWVCVLAVGAGGFLVHYGRPDTWLTTRWHQFRDLQATRPGDVARFGNASSNRYDYWRVAGRTLESHPLDGVGAGAFGVPWFRHRAITENVTDAHSWEAGALAETGVVGFLLLAAALLLPLVQLARARRNLGDFVLVALGGTAVYFVAHASLDWLFLITAVSVPAFVALGACASAGELPQLSLAPRKQRAAVALGGAVATVVAIPVYLSTSLTARAESQAATSTSHALDTLSAAARANPWAIEPKIVESTILLADGRVTAATNAAEQATNRGPQVWYAWQALANAERAGGHRVAAARAYRRARALKPVPDA
jgi:O-Antigen ligase